MYYRYLVYEYIFKSHPYIILHFSNVHGTPYFALKVNGKSKLSYGISLQVKVELTENPIHAFNLIIKPIQYGHLKSDVHP